MSEPEQGPIIAIQKELGVGYFESLYGDPGKFGLMLVQMLDEEGLSYEFNMLGVWQHIDSGRLFWAESAGCSCPEPFAEYAFYSPDDNELQEITPASLASFIHEVDRFPADYSQRQQMISLVEALLIKDE